MDVSLVDVKINQTNNSTEAKKDNTKDAPLNSFQEILAMFNVAGLSSKEEDMKGNSTSKNFDGYVANEEKNATNLSSEDWRNLDEILTALLIGIQQIQPTPLTMQNGTDSELISGQSQPLQDLNMVNVSQQTIPEISTELVQLLQKINGFDPSTNMDQNQVIQGLSQIFAELHTQEKQNSFDGKADIGAKIQSILDELSSNGKLISEGMDQIPQNNMEQVSQKTNPSLVLDKNQLILSARPGEIKEGRDSFLGKAVDFPKANEVPFITTQFAQGNSTIDDPISESPLPVLNASDVVPELSEWIGRFMKINNGQSGGTEARFSLYPEHLGHIEIKILSQEGQLTAQILTDTAMAKTALEGQLFHLRQALEQHGILVQKLDISQQSAVLHDNNQSSMSFSQNGSNSFREQKSKTSNQNTTKTTDDEVQNDMDKEVLSISYGRPSVTSSSQIDFTA